MGVGVTVADSDKEGDSVVDGVGLADSDNEDVSEIVGVMLALSDGVGAGVLESETLGEAEGDSDTVGVVVDVIDATAAEADSDRVGVGDRLGVRVIVRLLVNDTVGELDAE